MNADNPNVSLYPDYYLVETKSGQSFIVALHPQFVDIGLGDDPTVAKTQIDTSKEDINVLLQKITTHNLHFNKTNECFEAMLRPSAEKQSSSSSPS